MHSIMMNTLAGLFFAVYLGAMCAGSYGIYMFLNWTEKKVGIWAALIITAVISSVVVANVIGLGAELLK